MIFQEWADTSNILFADDGVAFPGYDAPISRWPRTEEDIQRQEMAEAWAEVQAIAPGLPELDTLTAKRKWDRLNTGRREVSVIGDLAVTIPMNRMPERWVSRPQARMVSE